MTTLNMARWQFPLLSGALALGAMVVPRLPHIRPRDIAGGVIPVGPLSGGLLDANTLLMSALLLGSTAALTAIRPRDARRWGLVFGLTPMVWMAAVMVLHGLADIWPIALLFAFGYGALMALLGVGVGKLLARVAHTATSRGAV